MHPIDQTSTAHQPYPEGKRVDLLAVVYRLFDIIISGARYHLVATSDSSAAVDPQSGHVHSVNLGSFWSASPTTGLNPLASPKSQILSSQSELTSRLPGFRSRWMTFAEWMYYTSALTRMSLEEIHLHPSEELVEEELDVGVW